MIADLHTHSHHSDGMLAPAALVALAASRGVALLALTDHDNVDGNAEAAASAAERQIAFVAGIELSCRWNGHDIHVVGLRIDSQSPALRDGLRRQQEARRERGRRIGERLEKAKVSGVWARACELAGHDRPGRPHFARAVVEAGAARDVEQAFNRYLRQGQVAYVPTPWASVPEAVGWIRDAGGVAVIAHPGRYRLTRTKLARLLDEFSRAGGAAMEVRLPGQSEPQQQSMLQLAARFGLAGSVGSDFHGADTPWSQPGSAGELPSGVRPVWELFQPV